MTDSRYDKLDCMLFAAMEQGAPTDDIEMFYSLDDSQAVFTRGFEKKKKQQIKCEKCKRRKHTTFKVLWRTAVVIMIIMSIMFVMMMSISAFRKAVVDVVVDFFDGRITFSNGEKTIPQGNAINEVKRVNFSHDGIVAKVVVETEIMRKVNYYEGDNRICSFSQSILSNNDLYYDAVDSTVSFIDLNGYEAVLIRDDRRASHLSWSDGEYFYVLSCYCTDYDVLELAYNVR